MKRIKIAFGVLAVLSVAALFAFTTKSAPVTTMQLYYHGSSQRIPPGVTGQPDPRQNSMEELKIKDLTNWNTTSSVAASAGNYINYISFDEEATADGGSDGQLTKQEVVDALWAYYISLTPDNLPSNGSTFTVGSAVVTVFRSLSVHA